MTVGHGVLNFDPSMADGDILFFCMEFPVDSMFGGMLNWYILIYSVYSMKKTTAAPGQFPTPETQLNILRRYLHVLALVQSNKDPNQWNSVKLADLLSWDEEGDPVSDDSVRKYIKNYLIKDMGLDVSMSKGEHQILFDDTIDASLLEKIALVYTSFVTSDLSREVVLRHFIGKHPYDCLWMLATLHFATIRKKKVTFDYTPNRAEAEGPKKYIVHPYKMVFKNNNLYLVALPEGRRKVSLYIAYKIMNLRVLEETFSEDSPSMDEVFQDTLGSFIGKKYSVKLRVTKDLRGVMEQILSIVEPEISQIKGSEDFEFGFDVADGAYLCKQLVLYGKNVEIVEPSELRRQMVKMLEESLLVYNKKFIREKI